MKLKTLKEFYQKGGDYSKEEILNYVKQFYHPNILENFEQLLNIQNMSIGQFGVKTVEDYTDGYIEDGNVLFLTFQDKQDFEHICYKEEDFFTEVILKFDENDILIDFYVNGDDLPLQYSLVEAFKQDKNNIR